MLALLVLGVKMSALANRTLNQKLNNIIFKTIRVRIILAVRGTYFLAKASSKSSKVDIQSFDHSQY